MKIVSFFWANNDRLVVRFRQDVDTLEKLGANTRQASRVASIDKKGKRWVELPKRKKDRRSDYSKFVENFSGVGILSRLSGDKKHILITHDDDQNGVSDIFKVNVATGASKLVAKSSNRLSIDGVDGDGEVRLATSYDEGSAAIVSHARLKGKKEWVEIGRTEVTGTGLISKQFSAVGFYNDDDPNELLVISNHESDTSGIYAFDLNNQSFEELLFRHPKYDALGVVTKSDDDDKSAIVAFAHHGKGSERYYIDEQEEAFYKAIDAILPEATNRIVSRSSDDAIMVIESEGPRRPRSWYLLKNKAAIEFIGSSMPLLKEENLAKVEWVTYKARDGMKIPALVTIPNGEGPFPAVIHPHGGPVARDFWGFDLWAQLMAHHGYVVIQPQFRISEGFGRKHLESGFGQWGLTLQDDLEDAANYLIDRKLAMRDKLAMFGWSYGGYASFVASLRDPNIFQCAVAGAGVSDLDEIRATLHDFPVLRAYRKTVKGLNPIDQVDSVDIPILVIHGDIDERVPVAHSRRFVNELKKHNKPHKYLELKGANHFFGTIYYDHWMEMFPTLIDWLDNTCGLK